MLLSVVALSDLQQAFVHPQLFHNTNLSLYTFFRLYSGIAFYATALKICILKYANMYELRDASPTNAVHDLICVVDWLRAWDRERSEAFSRVHV